MEKVLVTNNNIAIYNFSLLTLIHTMNPTIVCVKLLSSAITAPTTTVITRALCQRNVRGLATGVCSAPALQAKGDQRALPISGRSAAMQTLVLAMIRVRWPTRGRKHLYSPDSQETRWPMLLGSSTTLRHRCCRRWLCGLAGPPAGCRW